MKKLIATVSLLLAASVCTGCATKEVNKSSTAASLPQQSTSQETTEYQRIDEHYTKKSDSQLLNEAQEVARLLVEYSIQPEKLPEPNNAIHPGVFARIANYSVYNYFCAAAALTAKNQSTLYEKFISVSADGKYAVISREDISVIVSKLFGLDALPATLISSEEFDKENNVFKFPMDIKKNKGIIVKETKVAFDEERNISVDLKIEDKNQKQLGFYRMIFAVGEKNGGRFISYRLFYKI